MSIDDLANNEKYPFTKGQIRHFVTKRKENGLATSIRKIGRRLYIREDLFDEWVDSHLDSISITGKNDIVTLTKFIKADIDKNLIIEKVIESKETKIAELGFTPRTNNALYGVGIKTLEDLMKISKLKLRLTKGLGKKSIEEIEDRLIMLGYIVREE